MDFNKYEVIRDLPKSMQDKIQKLDFFKKNGSALEIILYSIVSTYNRLTEYKQKGLIRYYEEAGQQYYDPEGFNKKKEKMREKFEEIQEFLYCRTYIERFGLNKNLEPCIFSDEELEEKHSNDKIVFSVINPNEIIKDLETALMCTEYETTKEILFIVTGLKRLPRKNEIERELGIPLITAELFKE